MKFGSLSSTSLHEFLSVQVASITEIACHFRVSADLVRIRLGYLYRCRIVRPLGKSRVTRRWKACRPLLGRGGLARSASRNAILATLDTESPATITSIADSTGLSHSTVARQLGVLAAQGLAINRSVSITRAAWIRAAVSCKSSRKERPKLAPLTRLAELVAKQPGISSRDLLERWPSERVTRAIREGLITAVPCGTARRLYPVDYIFEGLPGPSVPSWHDRLLVRLISGPVPLGQVSVDRTAAKLLRPLIRLGWVEVQGDQLLGYGLSGYTGVVIDAGLAFKAYESLVGSAALDGNGLAYLRPGLFRRLQRTMSLASIDDDL